MALLDTDSIFWTFWYLYNQFDGFWSDESCVLRSVEPFVWWQATVSLGIGTTRSLGTRYVLLDGFYRNMEAEPRNVIIHDRYPNSEGGQ